MLWFVKNIVSFNFQHELLKRPIRLILKDDAIPALFAHNIDQQPNKRKLSVLREEVKSKRQYCEDAFAHQERIENFKYKCNSKETQTEITADFSSDFVKRTNTVDCGVQC